MYYFEIGNKTSQLFFSNECFPIHSILLSMLREIGSKVHMCCVLCVKLTVIVVLD